MKFLKQFFCHHNRITFVRNIYGDEINWANARSIWKCVKCEKLIYKQRLNEFAPELEDAR